MIQEPNSFFSSQANTSTSPFVPFERLSGGRVVLGGREFTDFTSWDVLGCGDSPALRRAVVQALDKFGFVSHSSRLSSGTSQVHLSAERRIAQFMGGESALLMSSRNQCVLSIVTALFSERDLIFFEESSEAPVADACALVGITAIPFSLSGLSEIEAEVARAKGSGKRAIFAEGVSISNGRLLEFSELSLTCSRIGAQLYLDDSGSIGLYGPRGAADFDGGLSSAITSLRYFALTHGMGLSAACISGRRSLVELIAETSRTLAVEHPLPPFLASSICSVVDFVELQLASRERLKLCGQRVSREFSGMGLEAYGEGPVVGVVLESYKAARAFQEALLERKIVVDAFPSPVRFKEWGTLRVLLGSSHTEVQISALLEGVREVLRRSRRREP